MNVQVIECSKIDVPKTSNEIRTFNREFAVKLADTIQAEGMYNPIVVRPNPAAPGRYLLVQGRHRLYAKKNVLKEQLIEANVIEDMDDAEAEMALIAENLWRNPLTKPQRAICIKKWLAHFMARNPEKLGRGKAGRGAIAKMKRESKQAESVADEGQEVKGETAASEAEANASEAEAEASFAKTVAVATGQSEASVKRTQKIAQAFDEEQLEAFTQMSTSQKDMLTIAAIKDEAKRGEVVNLIASGMEAVDAIKEVMGDQAPKRYGESKKAEAATEAKSETASEKADEKAKELGDDEWFDTYCGEKAAMFADKARFKSDALLYRKNSEARKAYRSKSKASLKATAEKGTKGMLWNLINRVVSLAHPKDWLICEMCKGKGEVVGADGVGVKCKKCWGGGYIIKTEEYL